MKRSSDDRWRGSVKVLRQTGQELAGDMNVAKEVTSPSALTEAIEVCSAVGALDVAAHEVCVPYGEAAIPLIAIAKYIVERKS